MRKRRISTSIDGTNALGFCEEIRIHDYAWLAFRGHSHALAPRGGLLFGLKDTNAHLNLKTGLRPQRELRCVLHGV